MVRLGEFKIVECLADSAASGLNARFAIAISFFFAGAI